MSSNVILENIDIELNHFNNIYPDIHANQAIQYFSTETFQTQFPNLKPCDLSVIHLNIRSIHANGSVFCSYLETLKSKFDVICLSETWNNNLPTIDHFFPSYIGFHSSRPEGTRGGGVSIFISKRFSNVELLDLSSNGEAIECIFVRFKSSNVLINIGCIYRPPQNNHDELISLFEDKLRSLNLNSSTCIICGDFNYDLFKISDDNNSSNFYDTANSR